MPKFIKFLALLVLVVVVLASPTRAQGTPKFSKLEVDIEPEYDKPSVLVVYRITLSPDTAFPADLAVRIPASAGGPSAVASKQVDGSLFNMTYQKNTSGDWTSISFKATSPEVQIEYYDPNLVKQGTSRHFEYTWPGGYAIDSLAILVQQPLGATDMRISPSLGSGVAGSDGLTYYTAQVGSLAADQTFKITFDYQKTDDTLSAEKLQVRPSEPLSSSTPGRLQLTSTLPYILGILGIVLIVGGAWWYWDSGRKKYAPSSRKRSRSRTLASEPEAPAAEGAIYCHQCGRRAGPGDRFCRSCGSPIRQE